MRIDLIRLLGLIAVVAGHVWASRPIAGYVAIFFVLSGYLWSSQRDLREEVRYRAWTLLIPYAAFRLEAESRRKTVLCSGGTWV